MNLNWSYLISAFVLGTFKYLPSHWFSYAAMTGFDNVSPTFFNLFVPTFIGAVVSMAVFYFASDFLMERAARKRMKAYMEAKSRNEKLEIKKKFTRMNKLMVKTKSRFGIYAFTFVVPLLLSIPLGSILCAKFYGDKKQTYPLMVLNMGIYGVVMSLLVMSING